MLVNDGICDCCDCSYHNILCITFRDESPAISSSWHNQCIETNTKQMNQLIHMYMTELEGVALMKKGPTKKAVIQELKQTITHLNKVSLLHNSQ